MVQMVQSVQLVQQEYNDAMYLGKLIHRVHKHVMEYHHGNGGSTLTYDTIYLTKNDITGDDVIGMFCRVPKRSNAMIFFLAEEGICTPGTNETFRTVPLKNSEHSTYSPLSPHLFNGELGIPALDKYIIPKFSTLDEGTVFQMSTLFDSWLMFQIMLTSYLHSTDTLALVYNLDELCATCEHLQFPLQDDIIQRIRSYCNQTDIQERNK